jgi:hypothetical protein
MHKATPEPTKCAPQPAALEIQRDKISTRLSAANPDQAAENSIWRLPTLYDLLVALSTAEALQDVYAAAVNSLLAAASADRGAILVFDDDGVARFKAWRGLSIDRNAVTGHTPWPRATRNAQPIVIADVARDQSLSPFRDLLTREGFRSLAFLPLALEGGLLGWKSPRPAQARHFAFRFPQPA